MATDEKGGSVISKNKSSRSGYTDNTESMSSSVWNSVCFFLTVGQLRATISART